MNLSIPYAEIYERPDGGHDLVEATIYGRYHPAEGWRLAEAIKETSKFLDALQELEREESAKAQRLYERDDS